MTFRVHWSDEALAELDSITSYIVQFDRAAAARIAAELMACADSLKIFPHRGTPIGRGLRRTATVYPYIVHYRIRDEWVEIVHVFHGARNIRSPRLAWSPEPPHAKAL